MASSRPQVGRSSPPSFGLRDVTLLLAVGHSILVICWHLLTEDCDYDDFGGDCFTRRGNPDKQRDCLIGQLHDLGYQVTPKKTA